MFLLTALFVPVRQSGLTMERTLAADVTTKQKTTTQVLYKHT